jgi:hypothetical protein
MLRLPMVLAFAAACPPLTAQGAIVLLPVGDLVAARWQPEAYLAPPALPGARIIHGEESWLAIEGGELTVRRLPGFYSADSLPHVLAEVTGNDEGSLTVVRGGSLLRVPRDRADAVRAALDALRQRLPAAVHVDLQLVATAAGKTATLLERGVDGTAGAVEIVTATTETTAVVDFDVEIAQAASIANPIVHRVRSGAMVVLRPLVSPAGNAAMFEVLARVVAPLPVEPAAIAPAGLGPLDRVALRIAEHAAVVRASLGGRTELRWAGTDGTEYALAMKTTWTLSPPARPGGHDLEYVTPCGAFQGFRTLPEWPQDAERQQLPGLLPSLVNDLNLVEATDSPSAKVAVDAAADTVRGALGALFDASTQGPPVEIACYDVGAGDKSDKDGAPPAGSRRLAAVLAGIVDDTWSCATAYDEQSFVRDWDVEVAQAARIPDPKVSRTHDGVFLNYRRRGDRLELEGELALRAPTVTRMVALDAEMLAADASKVLLPVDKVAIEEPVVHRLPFAGRFLLRAGTAATARFAAPALGDGREVLVVVRLRE